MDLVAIRAALRTPCADELATPAWQEALTAYQVAVGRTAQAQAEAAMARRPSTLKAALKNGRALERARLQLLTELRALGATAGPEPIAPLRLCS